ncbi:retrovirus-related pol polyprotein from transposon TNT 1-94 [Tanacetum coccineum]
MYPNMILSFTKPLRNEEKWIQTRAYRAKRFMYSWPKELSGGSTRFQGISDQLTMELRAKAHSSMRITMDAPRDRKCSAWSGGSLLAFLLSFQKEQRLKIGRCNYRLSTTFNPKEPTFIVALDVLSLTHFYLAFLITASVPAVYMHELWTTASYHKHSIRFKLNTKSYSFNLDTFRNMLQMYPKLPGQKFVDPPFEEEILTFMTELGYSGNIKLLSDVKVKILPQPWRTFGTIINKCLSGKVTGIDTLRLFWAQILWGLYHQKKVDYFYLL